ncbi:MULTISPECIES: sensor histidine kinase [unclassified Microbacterium]|uniref:sensor histidine kinase n=1 Tax=unclassified Microbacterium TaxID=2609290 RepID=UPI003868D33B
MTSGSRSSSSSEEELRLPRPPGVFRRFWSRHPVFADILIALLCLALSLVPVASFSRGLEDAVGLGRAWPTTGPWVNAAVALGCAALLWRRRFPVAVFVVAIVVAHAYLLAPLPIGGPLVFFAVYALTVYRGSGAALVAAAIGLGLLGLTAAALAVAGAIPPMIAWNSFVGQGVSAVIGGLVGANVSSRARYVEALIEHSHRLENERDQQAQLAAASERERIARELHDIVAHSLTVMVALAEGVAASTDTDRTRPGATAIAATGREALRDMRATLGILRQPSEAPLEPLVRDTTRETVASARAAGYETRLTVTGDPSWVAGGTQLAVSRIVQEAVTNAMRHAKDATQITISIAYAPAGIDIVVTDDGARRPDPPSPGYGLQGLRERVEVTGGTVTAGYGARGWVVRAHLPRLQEDS